MKTAEQVFKLSFYGAQCLQYETDTYAIITGRDRNIKWCVSLTTACRKALSEVHASDKAVKPPT